MVVEKDSNPLLPKQSDKKQSDNQSQQTSTKVENQTNKSINEALSSKASQGNNDLIKTMGSAMKQKVEYNLTVQNNT